MNTKPNAVYICTNKRCRTYHREFTAPSPAIWRQFTGRAMTCDQCGQLVFYRRPVTESVPPVPK